MKKYFTIGLTLSILISASMSTVSFGYTRQLIDRNNYSGQLIRDNGCWLATARNFIVAQQPNRSKESINKIVSDFNDVCRTVTGTTADITGSMQDLVDAMNEFDAILGNSSNQGNYKHDQYGVAFDVLVKEIANDGDPVAACIDQGNGVSHDILINGVDDGSNYTEMVRYYNSSNNGFTVWTQYYDLEHGTQNNGLGGGDWLATAICD